MPGRKLLSGGRFAGASLVLALICVTGSSPAAVAELALDYQAEAMCADRSTFLDLVEQRVAAASLEGPLAEPAEIRVRLLAEGTDFVGRLELMRSDGSHYQREVHGASCAEVANALAFVLALTLTAKEQPPAAVPAPAEVPKAIEPALVASPRVPEKPVEKRPSVWSFGAGVQLGARAGLAPEWALIEAAFLEVRRASRGPFGFGLRVAVLRAPGVSYSDQTGTTDFSWWAARLEGCPLRWRWLKRTEFTPCLGLHVGSMTVAGQPSSEIGTSGSSSQLWVDGFASSRLELAITHWLSLQAQAELLVPLTRFEVAFDNPITPVYQVPVLAGAAFAGLALHFP